MDIEQKRALLAQKLKEKAKKRAYPLSYAQERFWFFAQFDPGDPALNLLDAILLKGDLNAAALERAVNEIVKRHAILRTTFTLQNGRPIQQITPYEPFSLAIERAEDVLVDEREQFVSQLVVTESRRPFDLENGPLFTVRLLQFSPDEHLWFANMHHTVSDGTSFEIFTREVMTLYTAFANGVAQSPLAQLSIQYVDYVDWQRQQMAEEKLASQLTYWKTQLAGELPVLDLLTDFTRPAFRSSNGSTDYFMLPPELAKALKQTSRQEGCTLFVLMLAAFKTLLYRYTGQKDLLIGTPVAGRILPDARELIGLFTNTLVLRTQLAPERPFRDFLHSVRETTLAALANQEYPFEQLVDELQPERDPSRPPLFQVMFIARDAHPKSVNVGGVQMERLEPNTKAALLDLSVVTWETEQGQLVAFEYNTDLFAPETMARLFGHYETILRSIVADTTQQMATMPLMTAAEQAQLAQFWQGTTVPIPENNCIHHLFEKQAVQHPNNVALVNGDQHLTYGELNQRANQLAHYLRQQGVGPDVPVGIYLEKSAELFVSVLGILKAGGAYVPLDPMHPRERRTFMCQETKARLLLTSADLYETRPTVDIPTLCLDTDWPQIATHPTVNPETEITPDRLAYIIFTSGSTGTPKGVELEHRGLVNIYKAWEKTFELATVSSHLQAASFSFDVFAGEWTRALCSGGKLVVCPRDTLLDPPALLELMHREQVDAVEFVPAVVRALMPHLESTGQTFDFLKVLSVGSDAWYVFEYEALLAFCGAETQLFNTYGLSEATIDNSYFNGTDLFLDEGKLVPIGRPFASNHFYVLDDAMQPMPVGVAGELYVGGAGLARGYLNRPDLTAEKFIAMPASLLGERNGRLYRTGDLARFLSDGNIEFLGRKDHQVKIRGFRIELGEVQSVLQDVPGVKDCVVIDREDPPGDRRLVAYIVAENGQIDMSDLHATLKTHLPDYMLPAHYVMLDALPFSVAGKVNRRALPAPDLSERPQLEHAYEPPETMAEKALAAIFSEVTGVMQVGIFDNFFALGGHSLLATQLVSRIQERFEIGMPLRAIFEFPTIAELALEVEDALIKKLDTLDEEACLLVE